MLALVVAAVTAALVVADWHLLKQKNMRRERVTTIMFWLAGLGAVYCSLYGAKIPSVLLVIKVVYEPVNKLFGMWFH
ncbi:hypothetical protein D3C75_937160 [compost metagenome]